MEVAAWFILWGLVPSINAASLPTMKAAAAFKHKVFGVEREINAPVFPSEAEVNELEARLTPGTPCEHGWFDSCYHGAKLHYRKWIPKVAGAGSGTGAEASPKAIVIYMHGISTHSGKAIVMPDGRKLNTYLHAESLLKENIALYSFDMYGHGYSEGTRFFIPETYHTNEQDYISFCHLVAKEHSKDTPIFLMGESYGSALTLHVARYFQDQPATSDTSLPNLDSLVLTCPAIIGDLPPAPVVKVLTFLAAYFPTWRPFFMPNPVSAERIWRDPAVLAIHLDEKSSANIVDGSGIPFRLGTALNLVQALEDVRSKTIPGLTVPFLILHGTEDHAVPIAGSEFLWENAATPAGDKEFLRKEGAFHDLFGDFLAEECMQDVVNWINKRVATRKR